MLSFLLCSIAIAAPELPSPSTADTEVSTNMSITVNFAETSRIQLSISFDASPTNALEVSIGNDANGDGHLAIEESAYTFGYDCGQWFFRDGLTDTESFEPAAQPLTRLTRTYTLKRSKLNESWNLVKVTRRSISGIAELTNIKGSKPGLALILR